MTARALVAFAVAALVLMLPVYWHGVAEGEVLNFDGASEFCPVRPGVKMGFGSRPGNEISVLPLGNTCLWEDGVSVQLVPGWVNPALGALLAAAAVCLVAARRTPSDRSPG